MQKIIGISPRFSNIDQRSINVNTTYLSIFKYYNGPIKFIPLILTPTNLDEALNLCDGFIEIGGVDMDPKYYGENNDLNLSKDIDLELDEIDIKIINYAYQNKLPLLGICRGIQTIAAVLGGTLYQDMEASHLSHPLIDPFHHEVEKVNDFGLAKVLPDKFLIYTHHHQSVKDMPDGFIEIYKNGDIIEAMEHESLPIIGVQWHPEKEVSEESIKIFNYFLSKF